VGLDDALGVAGRARGVHYDGRVVVESRRRIGRLCRRANGRLVELAGVAVDERLLEPCFLGGFRRRTSWLSRAPTGE
jgi:hypothetical protein